MLDKMKLKAKLIDELMSVLDGSESEMRLKPKAIIHEEIIAHPKGMMEGSPEEEKMESPMEEEKEDSDGHEDDIASRIKRYMRK